MGYGVHPRRPKGFKMMAEYQGEKRGVKENHERKRLKELGLLSIDRKETMEETLQILEPKKRIDLKKWSMYAKVHLFEDWEYEELAEQLFDWIKENPKERKLTPFFALYRIAYEDFLSYTKKNTQLGKAWSIAKSMIGDRREADAAKGAMKEGTVLKTLGAYCPMAKEWFKESADMTKTETTANGSKIVYVEVPRTENSTQVKQLYVEIPSVKEVEHEK